ncbi:MAG: Pycsar system effector family protein [Bacteroidota bacterium]
MNAAHGADTSVRMYFMEAENSILLEVEAYVTNFITEQVPKKYAYHDIQHTLNVVIAARQIGMEMELSEKELEILQLAAWFHDTGYDKGPANHEERSGKYAQEYLAKHNYSAEDIQTIISCIMATKMPHNPTAKLQKIICDADLSHLGQRVYWERCSRVRQELIQTRNLNMNEQEWVDFELDFITNHQFHTTVAEKLFGKRKAKHVKQLRKQKARLNPNAVVTVDEISRQSSKKRKTRDKKLKSIYLNGDDAKLKQNLGRGVETMFRTTYRTHVNLSAIADNKANIMLSINAIVISITVSTLVPGFDSNPKLIFPTIILLVVCLTAMVFATLSTRPKVTEGKFTKDDIREKRSNLLFFGNFYNMELDDFHWGMMEMIKDSDFLYSSMTRDLYFLGVVLAKKYRFLHICYNVFMYGLIVSVLSFAIAFLIT